MNRARRFKDHADQRRWYALRTAVIGLGLTFLVGCQTWMAGMTLPTPHYLDHLPQYFPAEPDFPLPKELGYQEEAAGLLAPQQRPPAGGGINPVPGGGVPPVVVPGGGGIPRN